MIGRIANSSIPLRGIQLILAACLLAALPAVAQDIQPEFPITLDKKLAARATNVDEVTLNKNMLNFASQFLDSKQKDDTQVKHLVQKLNAIYVREYDFDKPDQYTAEDLKTIRQQFLGPEWNPMVRERSKKGAGDTDVYVKLVRGEIQGMFVLDAEPKELDFVYISGPIRPEDLAQLGGNFGIPNINTGKNLSSTSKGASK